jgi:hypothetical protein
VHHLLAALGGGNRDAVLDDAAHVAVTELRVLDALARREQRRGRGRCSPWRSGVTKTISGAPSRICSTVSRCSAMVSVESSRAASIAASSSFCFWSCMSAISGETTTVTPGRMIEGTW